MTTTKFRELIMWSLLSNIQRPIVKQKVYIYILCGENNCYWSFVLFIETKELCEARGEAKHEKLMIIPPFETARAQSELFPFQCG